MRLRPRGAVLFARTRSGLFVLCALAAMCAISRVIGTWAITLPYANGGTVPVVIVLPLLSACLVGTVVAGRLAQWEALSSRPTGALQAAYAASITLLAGALGGLGSTALTGELTWISVARNTALLCGLALIAAAVVPSEWVWLVPTAYVGLVVSAGGTSHGTSSWAFLVRPDADRTSAVLAAAVVFVGCLASLASSRSVLRSARFVSSPQVSPHG